MVHKHSSTRLGIVVCIFPSLNSHDLEHRGWPLTAVCGVPGHEVTCQTWGDYILLPFCASASISTSGDPLWHLGAEPSHILAAYQSEFWACLKPPSALVSVEKKGRNGLGRRCTASPRGFHPASRTPWPAWQADEIFPNSLYNTETMALLYHTEKQNKFKKTQQIDLAVSAGNLFTRQTTINHIANELLALVGEFRCTATLEVFFPDLWYTDILCSYRSELKWHQNCGSACSFDIKIGHLEGILSEESVQSISAPHPAYCVWKEKIRVKPFQKKALTFVYFHFFYIAG